MKILKIQIPKDQLRELEDLAHRAGCDDVADLIKKSLILMRKAVECVEDDGHVFFRYKDETTARLLISSLMPKTLQNRSSRSAHKTPGKTPQ